MLNKIMIMGRLTRNPELRHTQTGTPVAKLSLAVERDFKDKQTGTRAADFIEVVAWRGEGEFVSRYFTKGRMAVVEGRLQMRDWTDKDGVKHRIAEVIAENVYFGDSKRDGDGQQIRASEEPLTESGNPYGAYQPDNRWAELEGNQEELPF